MTHTVLAIVTCFSFTQGPSAIVFMYQILYGSTPQVPTDSENSYFSIIHWLSSALQIASVFANQLVLTGKMLNVVLFCMTSSTFRRKLLQTCRRWMYAVLYCDKKHRHRYDKGQCCCSYVLASTFTFGNHTRFTYPLFSRSHFSHSHSKSGVTQRTSLISWSARGMRSSIVSQASQKQLHQVFKLSMAPFLNFSLRDCL